MWVAAAAPFSAVMGLLNSCQAARGNKETRWRDVPGLVATSPLSCLTRI